MSNNINGLAMDFPVICIIGKLGAGKSLSATFIAKLFEEFVLRMGYDDLKIFSNYTFYDTKIWVKVKAKDIVKFPSYLRNGLLILDELKSEGGASYDFLKPITKKLADFITQIRKLNLGLIYVAQNFRQIVTGIRDITYYFIQITKLVDNKTRITIISRNGYDILNEFELDLSDFYKYFDTTELITLEEIENAKDLGVKLNEKI